MGFIGENGAGKSTLIRTVTGAVCPDCGNVEVLGCESAGFYMPGRKCCPCTGRFWFFSYQDY